jgi:hypothetical protein
VEHGTFPTRPLDPSHDPVVCTLIGLSPDDMAMKINVWFSVYDGDMAACTVVAGLEQGQRCDFEMKDQSITLVTQSTPVQCTVAVKECTRCHRRIFPTCPNDVNIFDIDHKILIPAPVYLAHSFSYACQHSSTRVFFTSAWTSLVNSWKSWRVATDVIADMEKLAPHYEKVSSPFLLTRFFMACLNSGLVVLRHPVRLQGCFASIYMRPPW